MLYYISLLLSLIFMTLPMQGISSPLLLGSIQFPVAVPVAMALPIFYDGRKIESEVNEAHHKIMFEIPWIRGQYRVYVLITEKDPQKVYKPLLDTDSVYNTIDYLKLPHDQPYKLYCLTLVPVTDAPQSKNAIHQTCWTWHIEQIALPAGGQIPDQTITILYFPQLVDLLEGGNHMTLPTIVMRSDMLTLCESVSSLYQDTVKLQLAALDTNAIHAPIKKSIQQNANKTIVIGCIT